MQNTSHKEIQNIKIKRVHSNPFPLPASWTKYSEFSFFRKPCNKILLWTLKFLEIWGGGGGGKEKKKNPQNPAGDFYMGGDPPAIKAFQAHALSVYPPRADRLL